MTTRHKIYFASDFHLGSFPEDQSFSREKVIIQWLDFIKQDASELYLVGDIFDFWFEYQTVIPKGFVRFIGKLAELADAGIKITLFKGNHDMWMFGYFEKELGATIISDELLIERAGKTIYLHHGDGLGPGDSNYKFLKKIFRSKLCQWLFARLHPNLGIGIARRWSRHSRASSTTEEETFLGVEREWLILHAQDLLKKQHVDYFIFGHRHLPYEVKIGNDTQVINLGEWINFCTYAVWDGSKLKLEKWKN